VTLTNKERAELKRQERLADMAEQVKAGTLVIRRATPKERASWPPPRKRPKPGTGKREKAA
jgi:hypothetical protein